MADSKEKLTIYLEDCQALTDDVQEIIRHFAGRPATTFHSSKDNPITTTSFECDVELFQNFVAVAKQEYSAVSYKANFLKNIEAVAERLDPEGKASIDLVDATSIDNIMRQLIEDTSPQARHNF